MLGRYLNHSYQGERLQEILEIVPSGSPIVKPRTKEVHRQLRASEIEVLVSDYLNGSTLRQVAQRLRINRDTASRLLERQGVPRRRRPLDPGQVAKAVRLYQAGNSLTAVGEEIGIPASTIWRAFKLAGVKTRDAQGKDRP